MEKFSFFNDVNGDRVYYAEDWARHLKKYFTNGIFNNELNVVSNNDMTITIKEGDANIEGYRYTNTGDLVKTIDNADGTLNRIDNVVLRLDLTNRLISAQIIKGTFADKPVAPELVRTSTIYDLRIAKISIPAGTTTITQDLITDTRFITSDCGNVISTVQTPDTENLFIQMQTLFEKQINELNNNFEIWFDSIKNQLDSDAAGNLQNQINNLNSNKVDNAKYDLDSNNLQLLANGKNVGDSVHIPTGITDTATGEEDLKIVNNKGVVKFSLEGKTEQNSYTGKNILDYVSNLKASSDGLTSVINDDGSITTSGKPSSNYRTILNSINIIDFLEDGETYTFSQSKASDKLYMQMNAKKKDGTYSYYSLNDSTKSKQEIIVNKSIYETYTLNIQTGLTSDWGDSSLTITNKYMLCKGTDTANTSFEPYVGGQASPNPDYPQEIENIKGVENLFKPTLATTVLNGITCAANRDGTYTLNGTATADTTFTIGTDKNLIIDKTYKFLGCPNGGSSTTYRMSWNFHNYEYGNGLISKKTSEARNVQITIFKGITASNLIFKPMFTEDTLSTYNDYVPYGTNYLQLHNEGKNKFDKNSAIKGYYYTSSNLSTSLNWYYQNIRVKPNTKYSISGNTLKNTSAAIVELDENKNIIKLIDNYYSVHSFVTSNKAYYVGVSVPYYGGVVDSNNLDTFQFEEGDCSSYEMYKLKVINIDLKGNNLCSNKDETINDDLIIENGRAKIYKKYGEYAFTGNESFAFTDNNKRINTDSDRISKLSNVYIPNPSTSKNITPLFCTHYSGDSQTNVINGSNKIAFSQWNGKKMIYFPADYSTIDEFKAKLKSLYDAGTPIIVQYPLAEPEVVDLGEVDFELLEGNSTLNLEEDLKSNMSIKYYTDSTVVDLKKKVENKQNVILHGTTVPSNDLGEDGDIYLQHN